MPFSITADESLQVLTLEGRVTIRNARELSALLADSLEPALPLEVETAQLTDIDTCVLQFLCSLRKSVSRLTFIQPSGVLLRELDRSQLRRALLETPEIL